MTNNVAFVKLPLVAAGGIRTTMRWISFDLHTCLMAEEVEEIQVKSHVAGQLEAINNTSQMKHQDLTCRSPTTFAILNASDPYRLNRPRAHE
jgi:hypothetical protein